MATTLPDGAAMAGTKYTFVFAELARSCYASLATACNHALNINIPPCIPPCRHDGPEKNQRAIAVAPPWRRARMSVAHAVDTWSRAGRHLAH